MGYINGGGAPSYIYIYIIYIYIHSIIYVGKFANNPGSSDSKGRDI